jgi:alkylation response protein AidB-like acyl-CoA dehydrogenase
MTVLSIDEARELGRSVREACERLASEERVREIAFDKGGFDATAWRVLCGQVGVATIAVPEELGGAGYGAAALGVVAHELGRALAPVPFLASAVLATGLLVDTGAPERVAALTDGHRTAAAILTGDGGAWHPAAITISARADGAGWLLDGTARHILNGTTADELVVVASVDGVPEIFAVEPGADTGRVVVAAEPVLDATRPMATISFQGTAACKLTDGGLIERLITHNVHRALAVLSAEQVGCCERVLEIASDYARQREQFGRPIGSFQAVKHRCADMLVDLEWARSASQAALQSFDDQDSETSWRTSMAKAVCSEALRAAAHANLQIHGGIGFTWEDSAHLYLKRARTDEVLFGGPGPHWDHVATEAKLF